MRCEMEMLKPTYDDVNAFFVHYCGLSFFSLECTHFLASFSFDFTTCTTTPPDDQTCACFRTNLAGCFVLSPRRGQSVLPCRWPIRELPTVAQLHPHPKHPLLEASNRPHPHTAHNKFFFVVFFFVLSSSLLFIHPSIRSTTIPPRQP